MSWSARLKLLFCSLIVCVLFLLIVFCFWCVRCFFVFFVLCVALNCVVVSYTSFVVVFECLCWPIKICLYVRVFVLLLLLVFDLDVFDVFAGFVLLLC